jgi:hypothetical protein
VTLSVPLLSVRPSVLFSQPDGTSRCLTDGNECIKGTIIIGSKYSAVIHPQDTLLLLLQHARGKGGLLFKHQINC